MKSVAQVRQIIVQMLLKFFLQFLSPNLTNSVFWQLLVILMHKPEIPPIIKSYDNVLIKR